MFARPGRQRKPPAEAAERKKGVQSLFKSLLPSPSFVPRCDLSNQRGGNTAIFTVAADGPPEQRSLGTIRARLRTEIHVSCAQQRLASTGDPIAKSGTRTATDGRAGQ